MSEFGVATPEQLAKINKLAKRKLTKEEVFVFPSKLAGDMIIPGRHVQLTKGLLDVFAMNANQGVSLLLDHSWSGGWGGRPKMAMPYGRTFDSRYEGATEDGETISLVGDHYMVRGVELDGIKTDDLISSVEAGTLFDTSIGFSYEGATCSVCDENYRRCNHYAGNTYEVEIDGVLKNRFCYIKANPPGFLMENSLVFDGAYPGAGVMSSVGDIIENEKGTYQVIEDTKDIDPLKPIIASYSQKVGLLTMVKKSDHKKIFGVGGLSANGNENLKGSEKVMDEKILNMLMGIGLTKEESESLDVGDVTAVLSAVSQKWDATVETIKASAAPLSTGEGVPDTEKYLAIPITEMTEKFGNEVSGEELMRLAKEGQDYHKQTIEDAIAMGVRAQGNDFTAETWKTTFANMGTKAIKDIMKTFELQVNDDIPSGRQSDPGTKGKMGQSLPDEAYRV